MILRERNAAMYPSQQLTGSDGLCSLKVENWLKQSLSALSNKIRCPLLSGEAIRQDSSVCDRDENKYFFDFSMVKSFDSFSFVAGPKINRLDSA
jgi:hypothetical protein